MSDAADREAKTKRRKEYLGQIDEAEQLAVARFMGTGPKDAVQKLATLSPLTKVDFKTSSLLAFQKYVSVLAGTDEDNPDQVWTKRKKLLDKAVALKLGKPG